MTLIRQLHCYAKSGVIRWDFIREDKSYFARSTQGKQIDFTSATAIEEFYYKMLFDAKYKLPSGKQKFYRGPGPKAQTATRKRVLVADPWASELPVDLQLELAALAVA